MLHKIIAFSIKNKLFVGLAVLVLIGYGGYELSKLPIDAVPDITDNQVQVITVAPALGAADIERLITFPIEQANSNIPKLKKIRSISRFGLSLVTIVFDDDADIYWARQQVSERLKIAQEQIPAGIAAPELAPVTTGLGEIYQYVLKPKHGYETKYDATELRTIQDWIVKRQLISVKGVADVSSFGGKVKQYEIAVVPSILKANNITISDVFSALEKNNENTGGAYIENNSTAVFIRAEGLIGNQEDIQNIVVKNLANGTPLLIKEVADIRIGSAIRYGATTYNDEGEIVGAIVMMLKGENGNDVIKNVKERIEQIKKTLPEGVIIEPFLDRSKMVNKTISTIKTNLLEGALIVVFVLVVFLGNFRAGILVASVIPLSMLFTVIMMNLFGVSGNLMSLGALDFGLIVDGAVIIVEAVMHSLTQSKRFATFTAVNQEEMDNEVIHSASKMMNSAVFGQIIILIVYLPIFTLQGIEGKMFIPMAQTVAFALLGAFLLSLTYIPMMSALFLGKNISHEKNISDNIMDALISLHQRYLAKILQHQRTTLLSILGLFVISLLVFTRLGGEFIPELPEGDFAVETRALAGSSIPTTVDISLKTAHILQRQFPEVEKVVSKIGSGEIPTDPMPMEAADIMVVLKDKSEWTSADSWNELREKMADALNEIPGVTFSFQYPIAMRFNELMTGAKQDVVCKIFGENLDTLSKYSKLLGSVATKIEGARSIYVEPVNGLPQIIVTHKRNAIAQYRLNIQDVNKVINTALAGQSSGLVFEDEKRFDLVVRVAGEKKQKLEDIQNLLIPTPKGTQIPLYQLADVLIKESVNQIQREDAKRRIIVGFNVPERDVQSVVNELQKQVEQRIKFPAGYYITYGGAFENLQSAKQRLMIVVPVALLLIFVLLFFAFRSLKQGLLIYSAIPLSAIGGILFLALRGLPFSISAGVGFIALFGVAVLNGIVLIAEFNRIKNAGEKDVRQIVLQGTQHRLRPVLMTAFVASLGFLPMALSNGAGAEVQRPLATVVIGGLLVATFLTLFLLPVLYVLFEHKQSINKKAISTFSVLLFVFGSQAQTPITLQAAIETALKNNLSVKNEQLNAAYQKKMKGAAVDIPQTAVSGQYNSVYRDNSFNISQSISFPSVYAKQKSLQNEKYNGSVWNIAIKETELKKQVSELFYRLIYLKQKQKILAHNDSMFTTFLEKAKLRFAKGESNILEKTTAETQRGQIALQLNQLKNDLEILQLQFQLLLNTATFYIPQTESTKLSYEETLNSSVIDNHPQLRFLQQQAKIAKAGTQLEKHRLLPNLNVGYTSTTILGNGADNVVYNLSKRFNSVQFGIGIPLFFGAQQARISSEKIQQTISDNNYQLGLLQLKTEYETVYKQYQTQLQTVNYFEKAALKDASTIIQTANEQFTSGEINYLEWTMLMNNAAGIQSNYVDAVNALNQTVIQLNYLTSK